MGDEKKKENEVFNDVSLKEEIGNTKKDEVQPNKEEAVEKENVPTSPENEEVPEMQVTGDQSGCCCVIL